MRIEPWRNVKLDHIIDFSQRAEKLLVNLGDTMTTVGQNIALEQAINEQGTSSKKKADFSLALQRAGNLSVTLGELLKSVNQTFGVEKARY
ncbi:hypothetical protein L2D08_23065 [Domibacillus sp. PGB-M46]|uniref:hypothetical protein n=1 Tax=Domibacillus sp. PGB-M46 TaxID=2910255 RepID=UPI001F565CB3|nr:hypothetical protein [Domibacillus sp. PGB-M46]MCI2257197.1 hypothetical protein [Domibacillus sp. PGB-M46]